MSHSWSASSTSSSRICSGSLRRMALGAGMLHGLCSALSGQQARRCSAAADTPVRDVLLRKQPEDKQPEDTKASAPEFEVLTIGSCLPHPRLLAMTNEDARFCVFWPCCSPQIRRALSSRATQSLANAPLALQAMHWPNSTGIDKPPASTKSKQRRCSVVDKDQGPRTAIRIKGRNQATWATQQAERTLLVPPAAPSRNILQERMLD